MTNPSLSNLTDLAWIAREGVIPEVDTEEDGSLFPDGTRAVECTNWARYARRVHGARAQLFGFFCDDNPAAVGMLDLAEGHDFAVLDGRYILDGWLFSVERKIPDPLIDIEDPALGKTLRFYYGDAACWERSSELERQIDSETCTIRRRAMQGVRRPSTNG